MESLNRKAVILTVIILANVSFAGTYSGGSGTAEDPYQIGTVADWNDLMNTPSDWDANFIMIADINLQGIPLKQVGGATNMPFFKGVFDGNGHVVRNAAITMNDSYIGLFGRIDYNSQILNLGVEDVNMSGIGRVAGLVGCSFGTISNCCATGKVSSSLWATSTGFGGLVGKNYGTITGSHAACDVNVHLPRVGGLVGWNVGTITDSYANGTVSGDESVGGLAGENDDYYDYNVGVLFSTGSIARCYATGSINGNHYVGGLVGECTSDVAFTSISDCYATGAVTGTSHVGGLVGMAYLGHITNCYAAGRVTGSGGGLIGPGSYPTSNCFWDINTTGQATSGSGTGLTTVQMKTLSIFKSAGWDFVDTWGIGENQTYPFLRTYSGADLTYDGVVNFNDFAIWANHWLESF
jgi:hypothetical protein